MKFRFAFTMIELVFVIMIMGIIANFGVEFLVQAYRNFIFAKVNSELQSNSASAVELISAKLQNRIKDSVIVREDEGDDPVAVGSLDENKTYKVLEWVGTDIDGFRGIASSNTSKPNWSAVFDLDEGNASVLVSPETNTTQIDETIKELSNNESNISDIALYFIGANSNIETGYGWDGNLTDVNDQNGTMHPVTKSDDNISYFISSTSSDFSDVDIYEYYKLAWSAYAIVMKDYNATGNDTGTLMLYWDYQPWKGESYQDINKSSVLMTNVSTFQYTSIGSILKIQVCVKSDLVEEYSICKEKTIF